MCNFGCYHIEEHVIHFRVARHLLVHIIQVVACHALGTGGRQQVRCRWCQGGASYLRPIGSAFSCMIFCSVCPSGGVRRSTPRIKWRHYNLLKEQYDAVQYLQNTFWNDPNLPHLEKLLKLTYNIFFDVIDKDYDLFCDMFDYELFKFEGHYEDAYPLFVQAGLAESIDDAKARYGSDAQDAVERVQSNPAYQSALRDLRLQDWREYHSVTFWKFDELHNLKRAFSAKECPSANWTANMPSAAWKVLQTIFSPAWAA